MTLTETKLQRMWQDVLERPDIQVNEEFLDLGGDSLSAMMCISRIRREFGIDVDLESFFMDSATIATIAARLDSLK